MMIAERDNVTLHVEDTHVLVVATGEVDVYTAPQLRAALLEAIASSRPGVVVDLRQVTFIDSSGLGVLVGGLKRAKTSGQWLRVVSPDSRILRLFDITGLTKVFDLCPTVEAALDVNDRITDPADAGEHDPLL
jgi:anti-sigma B factor antagonist